MSAADTARWDVLIRGARVFDGTGTAPSIEDVAIAEGKVAARGAALCADGARTVLNANGQWLMPGLLDIHTHFDLEVEIAPGLSEAIRHGTTTVVVGNCSLGVAFGNQRRVVDDMAQDPIVDCFARVENVPKSVLRKVADQATWHTTGEYLQHLDSLPLGPNIVPLLPHSMLRIEVMGLNASVTRPARSDELQRMSALLDEAMAQGYAGFSTDALPFHYLSNDPNRQRRIPGQHGSYHELKTLTQVVRKYDRVWQATPPKDKLLQIVRNLSLTSGRLFGQPLRVTMVAALDVATNRTLAPLGVLLARVLNSRLLQGHFKLQALAGKFKIWSDGALNPIFEEIEELRELNETDLEDRAARQRILNDPQFAQRFRRMWHIGKRGFNLARIKRWLRREDFTFSRELSDMTVDTCPVAAWQGQTLAQIYHRARDARHSSTAATTAQEQAAFERMAGSLDDEADFFLHLLREYDTDLIWTMIPANHDASKMESLLMNPILLPGFNDSGAHLTNMAFYDCNLRALQIAQRRGEQAVAFTVSRLTREPAQFFNLQAGSMRIGDRADLVLLDPQALSQYDAEANIQRVFRQDFNHHQLVNRSDGIITSVWVAGSLAWDANGPAAGLGTQPKGRLLRAGATPLALHSAQAA